NRIFNIEWRAVYFSNNAQVAHYEVRLHEGSPSTFDVVFGRIDQGGSSATVGVQQNPADHFTMFECNTASSLASGLQVSFALHPAGGYNVTRSTGPIDTGNVDIGNHCDDC